jgi:hypothetical protein
MKPIGHLHRLGCSRTGAYRIGTATVPDDDLHAGMLLQPGRQGFALPIREQIDRTPCLQIHQDGAVVMALAERPVVDTQHARGGPTPRAPAVQTAQQSVSANAQP